MKEKTLFALSYPFSSPDHSFLFEGGGFVRIDHLADDYRDRYPVLAAGSNQSPDQLARKYGGGAEWGILAAEKALLFDFDVVYAAHLAGYGSVPATFQRSEGTSVSVFILWLTELQLNHMHKTESNYFFELLPKIKVETEFGLVITEAFAYSARMGCLNHGGDPLALQEIPATNRRFSEGDQIIAQRYVRDMIAPRAGLNKFILETIEQQRERRRRIEILSNASLPLLYERELVIDLGE